MLIEIVQISVVLRRTVGVSGVDGAYLILVCSDNQFVQ